MVYCLTPISAATPPPINGQYTRIKLNVNHNIISEILKNQHRYKTKSETMLNCTSPLILNIDNINMYITFHVHILTALPHALLYPGIFMLKFSYRTKYIRYREVHTKLFDANLHVYYILSCSDCKVLQTSPHKVFFSIDR